VVQGGQVPEFQVQPDPAKLVQTGATISNILDAIGRSNMIDSPGLIETNHQLVLSLVKRPGPHPRRNCQHRGQDHARRLARAHRRHCHRGPSVMPVYTVVTANAKPSAALRVPSAGWQHRAGGQRRSCGDRSDTEVAARGIDLRPFYDQSELVNDSIGSVRDAILIGLVLASLNHGAVLRDWGLRWWPGW